MAAPVTIAARYLPITVRGVVWDLAHLDAFTVTMRGKAPDGSGDLSFRIAFSTHVFTERTEHGQPSDLLDHNGRHRTFDGHRYRMSLELARRLEAAIHANALTYVSRSFGGVDNLILVELSDGITWTVVYCLRPLDRNAVAMEILSSHPKVIDQRKISRRQLSYFARKCLWENRRIPQNDKGPT